MSYYELFQHRSHALRMMMEAKTDYDKAFWTVIKRWAEQEIGRMTAVTISA